MKLQLDITWKGPHTLSEVIEEMTDGGKPPDYDGEDYGIYQIYGNHILIGSNALLYIGKATKQKFSTRFKQHQKWLRHEDQVQIYLGRVYDPKRHSHKNKWLTWEEDMELIEKVMIHKYTPNYNSSCISRAPSLGKYNNIQLNHKGIKSLLKKQDNFPNDWI